MLNEGKIAALFAWANERHAIYMRKSYIQSFMEGGTPKKSANMKLAWGPDSESRWASDHLTNDPILSKYRFCNVYRELDRVTVWIRKNIREPYRDHEHLWFMLCAARYINWPATLAELMSGTQPMGSPLTQAQFDALPKESLEWYPSWPSWHGFAPNYMTMALERRRVRGDKVETGAYMIRAESDRNATWYSWSKQRYVAEVVLGKLWEARAVWQQFLDRPLGKEPTLQQVWERFQQPHWTGWGPFMAYQAIVDMRHTCYLREATDIQTWAAVGPGSRRGLNRLLGVDPSSALCQERALELMLEVRERSLQPGALAPWMHPIDLSDIQNCLCEFDKYERVRLGQGEPRSRYVPGRGW